MPSTYPAVAYADGSFTVSQLPTLSPRCRKTALPYSTM